MCQCVCRGAAFFPAERRASVCLSSPWTIARGSCPCPSQCCAIKRYTWPAPHRRAVIPLCICPAVCYPHAICHSARLSLCLCIVEAELHVPVAVSALSVCLPTCLAIRCVRSCAAFLSLYMPSVALCMRGAYASMFRLTVPRGSHILMDDWKIYRDQSSLDAAGSAPPAPPFSAHMTVAFKTHNCCGAAHAYTAHTHWKACAKIKSVEEI